MLYPIPMGKQIGCFIKVSREKRGLSQNEVAKLLKLKTAQSISNIERGLSPLPRTKVKRLAGILHVHKNELVTILVNEAHHRYSKAAGVSPNAVVVSDRLTSEECTLLQSLADRLRVSRDTERNLIKRRMERLL